METMPPHKKRRRAEYIPTELVEKILLNLPVKSLTRFSSVSKSWKSTILSRDFAKRYRGREMIVLKPYSDSDAALVSPLSSMPSGNPMDNFPRPLTDSYFNASCGELWCVEFEGSVCLYNPSMRTYRKLPAPSSPPAIGSSCSGSALSVFLYGLGYDSVTDDYKVLKFHRSFYGGSELYSQRSDSWRKISDSRENIKVCMSLPPWPSPYMLDFLSAKGVFVCGSLHWILRCGRWDEISRNWVLSFAILSFDLSMEKFGKVALPDSVRATRMNMVDVSVLRGKLCVYSNNRRQARAAMWVYDGGLWTKELVINYSHIYPLCYSYLKPLYFYQNINAFISSTDIRKMLILYKDESTLVEKNFGCGILDSFTYVESMVKP